ncbi:hypothetical protein QR680_010856 [Steinernema hermaphroditum]|uniref:Uncharacterized protein n=1 Tax=Steinernema hermaphroditum TaxID=289476 RepID=A0AA39MBV8_9BILA|nr:hypothetical protein QR680_010856 [Steinernema hermaphroditum]
MDALHPLFCTQVLICLNRIEHHVLANRLASSTWTRLASEHMCKLKHFNLHLMTDKDGNVGILFSQLHGRKEYKCTLQEFQAVDPLYRRVSAININANAIHPVTFKAYFDRMHQYLKAYRADWDNPALSLKMAESTADYHLMLFANTPRTCFGELSLSCPHFPDLILLFLKQQISRGQLRKLQMLGSWNKKLDVHKVVEPLICQEQLELLKTDSSIAFNIAPFKKLVEIWKNDPQAYSPAWHKNTAGELRKFAVHVDFTPWDLEGHLKRNDEWFTLIHRLGRRDKRTGCYILANSYWKQLTYRPSIEQVLYHGHCTSLEITFGDETSTLDSNDMFIMKPEFAF